MSTSDKEKSVELKQEDKKDKEEQQVHENMACRNLSKEYNIFDIAMLFN